MEVNGWEHHCVGRALLESLWTTKQSSPALRSLEAEYYAVGDGASRALGMQTAAKALGITVGDFVVGDGDSLQWREILSVKAQFRPPP